MSLKHLKFFFSHPRSWSVGIIFFILGAQLGVWAVTIPIVKERLQIENDLLGILLFFISLGALLIYLFIPRIIKWKGAPMVTFIGVFILCCSFALPTLLNNYWSVSLVLVVVGISISMTNVAVNTCVTQIELSENIKIMATCHGMYSIGLMSGSFFSSLVFGLSISYQYFIVLLSTIFILIILFIKPIILSIYQKKVFNKEDSKIVNKRVIIFPKGKLLVAIILIICVNFTEGTISDWAGIYMKDVINAKEFYLGMGLTVFSFGMAIGRFFGDHFISLLGFNKVILYGGVISLCGILLVILLPFLCISIIGFGLIGLGGSCVTPILYSIVTRLPNFPEGVALSTMNIFGLLSLLIGPVVIGFISHQTNLRIAFGFIAICILLWIILAAKNIMENQHNLENKIEQDDQVHI